MGIDNILENLPPHIRGDVEDLFQQYMIENKIIEEKLAKTEKKYQNLLYNLSDAILEIDSEGRFTYVSPQVVDLLGYQPEEVIGLNGFKFVHPEDLQCSREALAKALEGVHVIDFEYRAQHKDGYYVWFSASGQIVEEEEDYKVVLIVRDITKQKELESKYLSILRAAPIGIGVVHNRVFSYVSDGFLSMLGYSREELIGQKAKVVYPSEEEFDRVGKEKYAQIEEYGTGEIDTFLKCKDGKILQIHLRSTPVDPDDHSTGITFTALDITERKKAEEELKRSKNEREQILNSLVEHVVYQDTHHRILWANQAACDSVDKTLNQLVGKYCYQVWNQRTEPCIDCPVAKALQTKISQENEVITPDGRAWFIQGSPVFDINDEIIGAVETTLEITKRKRAEEGLRESKEKYQMLVEKLREGVLLEDSEGYISFLNPQFVKMSGYSEDELIGKHYSYIVPKEELEKVKIEASKRPKGISTTYEASILTKNKNRVPVIITTTSLFSNDGKFDGVLSVFTDITERKLAEEALRESKEQYQMLIEKMEEGVVFEDTKGVIRFVNPKMMKLLGYPEDELIGKHYRFIVSPEFHDLAESETKKRLDGISSIYESAILTKDGRSIPILIHASPIFSKTGEFEGILSVVTDITKRKRAEEALQKSEERYRKLVELSPDAITLTDLDANIIMLNQQTASLYGYTKDELIGKNSFELIAPSDQERAIEGLQETLELGVLRNGEYRLVRKDGSIFTAEINVEFLIDEERKPTGFIAVTRDITERIKAREEKERLEEMRKEFMDQAAHELRTPLTIIKGYTEFLQMRETNEENINILNTIMNNVVRLEELGTSVSDIYRIERGKFEVVLKKMDFYDFLENFFEPYLKLFEGQFHFNGGRLKDQVLISGDSKRLKNVLSNVLDNAVRNTSIEARKIIVESTVADQSVELVIKDNGAGIKPENLPRVFEKFTSFPTKYDITGTGIGLYITREIINAHNGTIIAYSEGEDKGTTITIKLPRLHE